MLDVKLREAKGLRVPLPASYNALAIVTAGSVRVEGRAVKAGELVLFANDGERFELRADEDTHLLVLAGEPIREPIVQYGPFVMNTREEIVQAVVDFEEGRFGPIPE